MLFSLASFVTLFTFLSAIFASPLEPRVAEYHLQTRIVNGKNDKGTPKGNLLVEAYHTGAGLNDAVLTKNVSTAAKFYLNGTVAQFDLGSPDIQWFMAMGGDTNYAGWELVQINAFDGSPGFHYNASGLQWNQTYYGFGGWLACDWWHGMPQLFWRYYYYEASDMIPVSCSIVDLIEVPV